MNNDQMRCSYCKNKKTIFDYNYAGFVFKFIETYAFPFRIVAPVIPKNRSLCSECVNKLYQVKCKAHGILKDKYEYGRAPRCYKCESDLSDIKKGILPNSFEALVPLYKLRKINDYAAENIWLAISKTSDICIIKDKNVIYSDREDKIKFELDSSLLIAKPIWDHVHYLFEIKLDHALLKGKGPWIKPWKKIISQKLNVGENNQVYLSTFEFKKVENNGFGLYQKISDSVFWTIDKNDIKTYQFAPNIPPLDNLCSWSINSKYYKREIKLFFKESNIPSILRIIEKDMVESLDSIADINLPLSKKVHPNNISLEDSIGIFKFNINDTINEKLLIGKKLSGIYAKTLSDEKRVKYEHGYTHENYLLLLDLVNGSFAVSLKNFSQFNNLCNSLKKPKFNKETNTEKIAFCFDKNYPGKVIRIDFNEKGFVFNNDNVSYSFIKAIQLKKGKLNSKLHIRYNLEETIKEIDMVGPNDYIHEIWAYMEEKRIYQPTTTNELYEEYNKLKRHNLLIGLLSDLMLLDKELDKDVSIDEIYNKILILDPTEFHQDKYFYDCTIKKLLIFVKSIPNIKQNFEVMHSFFPHYCAQDEMNFICEAFGNDVANKLEEYEKENVINNSRRSIELIQSKLQKSFFEMERALAPVENIFAKEEIQKEYMAKVAKFAPLGGQTVLVGTLLAVGGAAGPVGILAGMLGIRAMSDFLNVFKNDRETAYLIKQSAQKVFSWWNIFKKTLPVTIYELDKFLIKENKRCLKRDNTLYLDLNKKKKFSIENIHNAVQKKIIETNKVRYEEIIKGTGIIFEDVAIEIDKRKKIIIENQIIDINAKQIAYSQ